MKIAGVTVRALRTDGLYQEVELRIDEEQDFVLDLDREADDGPLLFVKRAEMKAILKALLSFVEKNK